MASVNKVILIGYLSTDPDMKQLNPNTCVTKFSLATSKKFKDAQGVLKEETAWHRIVTWNKTAENCAKFLSKGSQVYLEGEIVYQMWEKDGQKMYGTEIKADMVNFLSPANNNNKTQSHNNQDNSKTNSYQGFGVPNLDDIPF